MNAAYDSNQLHVLRNPYGFSDERLRDARNWAADRIEALQAALDELVAARDEARRASGFPAIQQAQKRILDSWEAARRLATKG